MENKQEAEPCQLELRLGLPGDDEDKQERKQKNTTQGHNGNYHQTQKSFSMGYFPSVTHSNSTPYPPPWGYAKDSSQPCHSRMVQLPIDNKNCSQKRSAPVPVVGWPPVRSFRKNLTSSSSAKPAHDPPCAASTPIVKTNEKPKESSHQGLFVKINMDGVAIGRKVDLRAYDNYDKLCSAVDTLFRGLLAAQTDSSLCQVPNKQEVKPIIVMLDGSGEYTLVYEDNEGDKMLIGDIPWDMFVSTVKRLRVLKSSSLPSLNRVVEKLTKKSR